MIAYGVIITQSKDIIVIVIVKGYVRNNDMKSKMLNIANCCHNQHRVTVGQLYSIPPSVGYSVPTLYL